MDTIVYDIETASTKGWANAAFASAVAYSYDKDRYYSFLHLSGLAKLIELLNKNKVITFNGIKFDSKVVLGNKRKIIPYNHNRTGVYISGKGTTWLEYDIFVQCLKTSCKCKNDLEACKKRSKGGMKLDDICRATLGICKSGNGADAPILYQQQKYDELLEYNLNDVKLTKKLYDYIIQHRFVFDKNKKNKIKIPHII